MVRRINTLLAGWNTCGRQLEIDEMVAAKYPIDGIKNGGVYGTDRAMDGPVVKP